VPHREWPHGRRGSRCPDNNSRGRRNRGRRWLGRADRPRRDQRQLRCQRPRGL